MGHGAQQPLPLDEAFADETELEILEIAKPAVKELCGRGRCCPTEVVHLSQPDAHPAARGIASDPAAVHAAADNEKVKIRHLVLPIRQIRFRTCIGFAPTPWAAQIPLPSVSLKRVNGESARFFPAS